MQHKPFIFIIVFSLIVISLSVSVIAAYGEGNYGEGKYGEEASGSSGGNRGSGGGSTVSDPKMTVTKENIQANTPTEFKITNSDIPVTTIILTSGSQLSNVQLSVTKLNSKPLLLLKPSNEYTQVYTYLDIQEKNVDANKINNVSITFSVSRNWLQQNGLQSQNVVLLRWNNLKWNELSTSVVSSDEQKVLFMANTPGFSYFAIATKPDNKKNETIIPVSSGNLSNDTQNKSSPNPLGTGESELINPPDDNNTKSVSLKLTKILVIILIIVISVIIFFIIRLNSIKRKLQSIQPLKKELTEDQKWQIQKYIKKAKGLKLSDDKIIENLKKGGLSDEHIATFDLNPKTPMK